MKICGIYKITSPSNKIYIGQSIDVIGRFKHYNGLHCKLQTRLYNSLNKYGVEKHKFEVICQCSREELNDLEVYYIALYNSFNSEFGMNLRSGGMVSKASDETKQKQSVSGKNKKPRSEETRKKISIAHKGKTISLETRQKLREANLGKKRILESIEKGRKSSIGKRHSEESKLKMGKNNIGKKRSEETKLKINLSRIRIGIPSCRKGVKLSDEQKESYKGRIVSEETKQKLREINLGKKHTEETRKKMSLCRKGELNSSFGKVVSNETKAKISQANLGNKVWLGRRHTEATKEKISIAKTKNKQNGKSL